MSQTIAIYSDLDTYLGMSGSIDTDRAQFLLDRAYEKCLSVISPVPDTAMGVMLDVAARAYVNPNSAHQMAMGSASVSYGAPGAAYGVGGIYLSKANIAELRRLGGRSGAYSIDPTPSDAGTGLQPWDSNVTWLDGVPLAEDQR